MQLSSPSSALKRLRHPVASRQQHRTLEREPAVGGLHLAREVVRGPQQARERLLLTLADRAIDRVAGLQERLVDLVLRHDPETLQQEVVSETITDHPGGAQTEGALVTAEHGDHEARSGLLPRTQSQVLLGAEVRGERQHR
jgi:hypothetical protein